MPSRVLAALLAIVPLLGAGKPLGPVVRKLDIEVTLAPTPGSLEETVELVVDARGTTRLVFALDGGLVVKSSRSSAGVVEHRQAGDALIVDVDPPLDGPRTLGFTVAGRPRAHSGSEIGASYAVLAPGTPWYPALPTVWAASSVTVHVPDGWRAIAPGVPASPARWVSEAPVRSLAVAAAPDLRVQSAPLITTTLHLATSGDLAPTPKAAAARLAPGLAWLSGALAPYPFESFNLVMLSGFSGRVEASGLVVIGREAPFRGDEDGADVLAGQWFGQALGGDGAWIASFAAWQACVFARDRALPLPAEVVSLRARYFELRSGDVALASATADSPPSVVRGKGSAAPDMLRLAAGDRAMFDAVRELFARKPVAPVALADLRTTLEKHAGRSLTRAFADWFERSGAPEITASLRSFPASEGGFRADVALVQKRGLYALPVEVVIRGGAGERRETIEIADETTAVFYVVPFEPKRIEIDPQNRIFRWK